MGKSKVVPLRIPENLNELATLNAQERHTDKATALRQWLHEGAAHYVLNLVAEGRVSVGCAAELLDATPYDVYHSPQKGIHAALPTTTPVERPSGRWPAGPPGSSQRDTV